MGKCNVCDSRLRPGSTRRVLDLRRTVRRVCEDCASMLTPPEELGGAAVRSNAGPNPMLSDHEPAPAPAPNLLTRATVRATAATTVALAPRGWALSTTKAIYVALTALALAVASAWLIFSSGPG